MRVCDVCRSLSIVSPLLTLLHAPRFYTKTEALPSIVRRTTQKESCRNGRRLSSAFACAVVVVSFVVSVWLPTLSKDGFGVQFAKDFVAVSFISPPAIGSERDDLEGLLSSDVDLWSDVLFFSCLEPALEKGGEPMKTPSLTTQSRGAYQKAASPSDQR